jgi:hypothetical protein
MKKMNLQLFASSGTENSGAENNTNGTNNPNAEGNGGEDGAAAGSKQTYTQEDLDKIVAERTGRAEKSALKSFFQQQGLTEEEANSAIAEYKKTKAEKVEASKNDAKAQADRADAAEKAAQEAIAKANVALIKANAQIQASNLGVKSNKLEYVVKMADLSKITIDDDGNPDDAAIKAAVEQVLKDVPELKDSKESSGFKIGADGNKDTGGGENDTIRAAFGLPPKKK